MIDTMQATTETPQQAARRELAEAKAQAVVANYPLIESRSRAVAFAALSVPHDAAGRLAHRLRAEELSDEVAAALNGHQEALSRVRSAKEAVVRADSGNLSSEICGVRPSEPHQQYDQAARQAGK